MIRPIDTQVLYPQTPEIAGRQQRNNQLPTEQQAQFGNLMKKEVESKKDTIVAPHEATNLKTNKDKDKQSADQNSKGSKKKQQNNKGSKKKNQTGFDRTIDIRI